MTMIRPETEMKESGASWMGKIPCEWSVSKLKWYLRRIDPRNPGDKQVLSLYREYGVIPKDSRDDNHNATSEDTSKYKYVRVGDFVVNKMKAWQGSVAVSEYDGIVSPAYYVYHFTDDSYHRRYFHYLLRSCYKEEFMRLSGGIRVGQWDLSSKDLDNVLIVIPKKEEQQAIADYLDETCFKIDEIIAEAKASIDEYKELRIAIIDDFTICGFNKTKLKYISKKIGDGLHGTPQYSDNGTVAFINGTNIGDEKITIKSNTNFVSIDEAEKHKNELNSQTILISLNGTIGNSSLYDGENIILGKSAGYITLKNNVCREYVRYCLENSVTKEAFDLSLNGTTIPNLSLNTLRNTEICLPDYSVQKQLAKTIKKMIIKMDSLIAEKESLINDLEAYKKSLIYEVVTGKRRVV